jgi:undecaprenyl-diphosphatase
MGITKLAFINTNRFDKSLTNYVQGWPHWLQPIMNTATLIGEPVLVVAVALSVGLIAWRRDNPQIVKAEAAALIACGLNAVLKQFLHRTRPDTLYVTHMKFKSYSFPSGHAFGSVVVYGLLAYLAFKYLPQPWNVLAAVILGILILLVGLSRVYLGAHFPTDVLGGWILGAIALILIIIFIKP